MPNRWLGIAVALALGAGAPAEAPFGRRPIATASWNCPPPAPGCAANASR
jgi:hypothetical protein